MNVRLVLWFALLLVAALLIWRLAAAFPGRVSSDFEVARVVWLFALLAVISSGVVFSRRVDLGGTARNIAIWVGITAFLVLAFTFQDELRLVWQRVRSEIVPGYPVATETNEIVLAESVGGHFRVIGSVNGMEIDFLVDTGASNTVLAPADAARLGMDVSNLDYSRFYETANGAGRGAPVTLDTLSVGPIVFYDFPASVNEAEMGSSLLGMSFLRRLESFEVRDRRLYLRW